MLLNASVYILSFFAIWFGAGLIVSSVDKFARKLGLSSFAVSFFILGMLTSTPEFAVGLTAIAQNSPDVFVGNLIGGIPVIFLFIVPILAIIGNGVKFRDGFGPKRLLFAFIVMLAPAFFVIDKKISSSEALLFIILYLALLFIIETRHGLLDIKKAKLLNIRSYSMFDLIKIIVGIGIVFVASHVIVDKTVYFAKVLNLSLFYVSLIILSFGTNLPELSLAVKSAIVGKKDVAFGDYVGSGAANVFLFGLLTLLYAPPIATADNFLKTFILMATGLGVFYYFASSKGISRKEGFILLLFYIAFVVLEAIN